VKTSVLTAAVVVLLACICGCGTATRPYSTRPYSVREVETAFADHGIKLTRSASSTYYVFLHDGRQVGVVIRVNSRGAPQFFSEKATVERATSLFFSRAGVNILVGYRAAQKAPVVAALTQLAQGN
jgi:hypothetical protein